MSIKNRGWVVIENQGTHHFDVGQRLSTCLQHVCGLHDKRIEIALDDACTRCAGKIDEAAKAATDEIAAAAEAAAEAERAAKHDAAKAGRSDI